MISAADLVPHPIILDLVAPLGVLLVGSGATLGLTHARSGLRLGLLPVNLTLIYRISSAGSLHLIPHYARLLAAFSTGITLHWIDVALVSRWTFDNNPLGVTGLDQATSVTEKDSNTSGKQETPSWLGRLWWGILALFESRRLNTWNEAKNIPALPSHAAKSRLSYVRYAATRVIICYLITDLLTPYPAFDEKTNAGLFALTKVPVFARLWRNGQIPLSELGFRALFTFSYWFLSYNLMTLTWILMSVMTVGSGFHEPRDWKPFFGPISQSYNLRGFWGKTWQQGFRYPFSNTAEWLVQTGLRLREEEEEEEPSTPVKSWIAKYAKILVAFALSGILHVVGDAAAGDHMENNMTMQFFLMQALGIMLEDHVRDLCKILRQRFGLAESNRCDYAIGYLWCAAFLIWTTPQWIWPCLVTNTADLKPLMPFSFAEQFFKYVQLQTWRIHD